MARNAASSRAGWLTRKANARARALRKPLLCIYCQDPATSFTGKGPACQECAAELETGQVPPMAQVTGKHPVGRRESDKVVSDAVKVDLWDS